MIHRVCVSKWATPHKVYPIDTRLIDAFDRTGRVNVGHALETAVLIELQRRSMDVCYGKTPEGLEVDFVARSLTGDVELIQVCADLTSKSTLNREARALLGAREQYPEARRLILTLRQDTFPREGIEGIEIQTAWQWILEN